MFNLSFKEQKMTLYQVVNEQNHPLYAFLTFQNAAEEVEVLNENHEDHYYHVNEIVLNDIS